MTMNENSKEFDCVAFKRAAQLRIYERIKDLSPLEEIEYFRNAAEQGPLGEHWKAVVARAEAARPTGRPQ